MARLRRSLYALAWIVSGVAIAIGLLHFTVADLTPLSAWIFYFAPLPLVAALLAAAATLFAMALEGRFGLVAVLGAFALYGYWVVSHTYEQPCDTTATDVVRVVSRNVNHLRRGADTVTAELAATGADVIGLVEASHPSEKQLAYWRERFPEHSVLLPGSGLVLLVRGNIASSSMRELNGISRSLAAEIEVHGRAVRLVLVDLDASPRFDKRTLISRTFDAAEAGPKMPTIVMGDFNTPIESRWFREVRRHYEHAFERAGSGFLATWPASRPLLAIDHIWTSAGLSAVCARLERTSSSDHLLFRAELRFAPTQREPPGPL